MSKPRGLKSSMMVTVRQPGHRSRPHTRDADQLNYVLEGEVFIVIDQGGFLARKGDIFRIPRNAVHWSTVQGEAACILLETPAPPLIENLSVTETALALIAADGALREIVAGPS